MSAGEQAMCVGGLTFALRILRNVVSGLREPHSKRRLRQYLLASTCFHGNSWRHADVCLCPALAPQRPAQLPMRTRVTACSLPWRRYQASLKHDLLSHGITARSE